MNGQELAEYVKRVADLESAIYTQKNVLLKLDQDIEATKNVQKESYYRKVDYSPEKIEEYVHKNSGIGLISLFVWAFISLPILLSKTTKDNPDGGIIPFFVETGIIIAITIIIGHVLKRKEEAEYMVYRNRIDAANEERFKAVNEQNKRIKEANAQIDINFEKNKEYAAKKREMLNLYRNKLVELIDETKNTLAEYYAKNIIYPKYQNMIAVSSFNDYIQSGVCDELGGHEGCYNKFDVEIRLDTIINKMDDVLVNLEKIQHNQHTLYTEIVKCNAKLDQLYTGMQEMTNNITGSLVDVKTSTIAALADNNNASNPMLEYYAKENARNIADIKWVTTMNYLDNGGWTL